MHQHLLAVEHDQVAGFAVAQRLDAGQRLLLRFLNRQRMAGGQRTVFTGDRRRHLAGIGELGLALVEADFAVVQGVEDEYREQAEQTQQQREEEFLSEREFHVTMR
jgi:hypothetical protein